MLEFIHRIVRLALPAPTSTASEDAGSSDDLRRPRGYRSPGSRPGWYVLPFPAYDADRFSRPWIGRVVAWPITERPRLEWGHCIEECPGAASRLTIEGAPGDIVRWGIKDYVFGERNQWWGLCLADGSIERIDAAEAFELYSSRRRRAAECVVVSLVG